MDWSPKYKRVLLKLSGEALATGVTKGIINFDYVQKICLVIKDCVLNGVEVGIVVGAGNIWRGRSGDERMDRARSDHMGMIATVINALALQDALEYEGVEARVQTAVEMKQFAEPYIRNKAISHFNKGRVVIFACGLGSPYFSTDTAAVLRAKELACDIVLLAKNVDGVYNADPRIDPQATKFSRISYMDILSNRLGAMDSTATSFSMDNHIPILVFGLDDPYNIIRAVSGELIGTIVRSDIMD